MQDPNNYWEQLERLEKLIRASELKAGVLFSFHGIILGIVIEKIGHISALIDHGWVFMILAIAWIISMLISIYYCFKCFKPRIERKYDSNVFFFRDAVHNFDGIDEYAKQLQHVCQDSDEFFKQLSEQIHVESKIIDEKFRSVQKAITFFGIGFIVTIIIIFAWIVSLYI